MGLGALADLVSLGGAVVVGGYVVSQILRAFWIGWRGRLDPKA